MNRRLFVVLIPFFLGFLAGCGGSADPGFRGLDETDRYIGPASTSRAALSVMGEDVTWGELSPLLAEAAGAVVVEELTLDRALEREAKLVGVRVTDADLQRERAWLARAIEGSAGSADTPRLILEVRQRRGLGPARFEALLRRNALLRAMVRDQISVTEEQLRLAHEVQHGPRVRIRILVVSGSGEAQAIRSQLAALGGDALQVEFASIAQARSTDSSASLGGLLEPFSPSDPAYEAAVRQGVRDLPVGALSPVMSIENGYAIACVVERSGGDGVSLDQARAGLTEQLSRRQERLLMDELATRLLAGATVRGIDPSLAWSIEAGRAR